MPGQIHSHLKNRRAHGVLRALLVQLPIPPAGIELIKGNVPLAAAYLKLMARLRGLEPKAQIDILPAQLANTCCDLGLVREILARDPDLVGFTCYVWNIERTLWIAERLKQERPKLQIVLGGPEITWDNAWVLQSAAIDFAVIGEGEQTFADLLESLMSVGPGIAPIDGLLNVGADLRSGRAPGQPRPRKPLANLDPISSPYLAGILDAADDEMLLLETVRGCVFKCKFCYYPKSYDSLYFLSPEKLLANLDHAARRGAREVVLLDPTLNQRRDFADFLRLLGRANLNHHFTYFGELRAEGIQADTAALLRDANFTEVEIGLQSLDPLAQDLMDRKNNLRAFERGVRALLDVGIRVKIDLIIGLPGDTVASVRRGLEYLHASGLYSQLQVFHLGILPGTAFRQEAAHLGLTFQALPPYYVINTPTLDIASMYGLMEEAQDLFGVQFDPLPLPCLDFDSSDEGRRVWRVDLDAVEMHGANPNGAASTPPAADQRSQAYTLWMRCRDFSARSDVACGLIGRLLDDNPFTTLQVVLEPTGDPRCVTPRVLDALLRRCFQRPTYLERFYSVQPGQARGGKHLVLLLPAAQRERLGPALLDSLGQCATIVWRGAMAGAASLAEHEYAER